MASIRRFRIETDRQIARALLSPASLTRRQLMARANLVGIHYRALGSRIIGQKGYNSPSSPFEKKDQLSVLDKAAFKVEVVDDHLEISVNAPAAQYVEEGNAPGPSGERMAIRVKDSKVRRKRGKRGKTRFTLSSGTNVRQYRGKFYIFAKRARPAKGYRLLEKAVRSAFRGT